MKIKAGLRELILVLFTIFLLPSCEKEEGEGGTGTIEGRVYALNYNSDFSIKLGEYYAPDVDVFII